MADGWRWRAGLLLTNDSEHYVSHNLEPRVRTAHSPTAERYKG